MSWQTFQIADRLAYGHPQLVGIHDSAEGDSRRLRGAPNRQEVTIAREDNTP